MSDYDINAKLGLEKFKKDSIKIDNQIIDLILNKLDKISKRTKFFKNIIIILLSIYLIKKIYKLIKIFINKNNKKKSNILIDYKKYDDNNIKFKELYEESSCFDSIVSECGI